MSDTAGDQDAALVRRMAAGRESALAALYDRWHDRVHSTAIRLLEDSDEAAEVVEETFWRAWTHARSYDERRARVGTWLTMIGRSCALDRLRARRRRQARMAGLRSEAGDPRPRAGSTSPADHAETAERGELVRSALRELPAEQLHVLELAFFEGLSHSEIAARMSLPLGTVKSRVRSAMERLRRRLVVLTPEAS